MNFLGTKAKYDIVYFKYFLKYVYLSRIHIINTGECLYFYISLYVARPFTNPNFGITGTSEMVPTSFVSKSSADGCVEIEMQTSVYMLEG
jgi:hypothetical protein